MFTCLSYRELDALKSFFALLKFTKILEWNPFGLLLDVLFHVIRFSWAYVNALS